MRKLVLCCFLLALATTAAVADTQLLSNPGFETGSLSPWFNARDFCSNVCSPWAVTNTNPHSGTFSAVDTGNIELRQDFTATPGSQITNISFWINSQNGFNAFDLFYTDGSDQEFVVFPTANVWTFENVTADVDTSKTLSGFSIFGTDPSFVTYVDDASITASGTTTPEPATLTMLGSGLLAAFGAARRRMKA
jgi:hypothetical protein